VFRGTLDFDHQFNASTSFFNYLLVETGADNTFVQDKIGIQVKMSEVLALAVAYAVRYNTDPPTGFEEMDTLTTVNLVYELK
jgi:putative salt-induced outer membrane protein